MKLLYALLLLSSAQVFADSRMKELNQFMDLVAVKWGVNSELEKSPDQYRDEEW